MQPTGSSSYAQRSAASGWALTAANCVLTFTGTTGEKWLARVIASIEGAAGFNNYGAGISYENDLDGVDPNTPFDAGVQLSAGDTVNPIVLSERLLTLTNGDEIKPDIYNEGANINILKLSLVLIPVL
jgi:hypothetical protein